MDAVGFAARTGVSRETVERLEIYAAQLRRWNRAINLVAPKILDALWSRHFLDSWQLLDIAGGIGDAGGRWYDLGSGGGFPGLVLVACGLEGVTLIESDRRKTAFLRETARAMGVDAAIHAERIEDLDLPPADTITARALAPLPKLLDLSAHLRGPHTRCLFLKGQDVESELTAATKYWKFTLSRHRSLSDKRGTVLVMEELTRRDDPA